MMIATEPLPEEMWERIGLAARETFTDGRHLLVYGQRTADGRLAFGGRGAPYHFGSAVKDGYDRDDGVAAELTRVLHQLLPVTRDATHHPPLGRPPGRSPGLVCVGRARPHHRAGVGGWLRG